MGQLPNNEIPANRASQNQRVPRASVPPRVQPVPRGDIAGEIRGIVSRPLAVPARPHFAFPKLVAVMGVLLVAGLVAAKIQNEKSSSTVSGASSSTMKSETPKAPSTAEVSIAPRHNVQAQTVHTQTGNKGQARTQQTSPDVNPELLRRIASSPAVKPVQTISLPNANGVSIPDRVESSTRNSSSDTGGIRGAYVPSATPPEKTPMPERTMSATASASNDYSALTEMPSSEAPSVPRQRTLTPEQKLAAGIPYETNRVDSLAAPSVPLQRTLTPDQKRAAGIPYEARSVVNRGGDIGLRRTQPPATSTRPRADVRVPLLPPPPGLR